MNDVLTTTLKAVRMNRLAVKGSLLWLQSYSLPLLALGIRTGWAKAGFENFTFHDVQHTSASRLVMAGVDFPTVKELMDHKDITMRLRHTHLSSDYKQHAVRTFARLGERPSHFYYRPCQGCCHGVRSI
jgi:integrase